MITKMQSEEVCELRKKLGIVIKRNEGMVLRRILEIEDLADEGKKESKKYCFSMKILSYNVRGVGARVKKQVLRVLIGKYCLNFV